MRFAVDDLGFVDLFIDDIKVSHLYTFCHYYDSSFTPLNHLLRIPTKFISENTTYYSKRFESFSDNDVDTAQAISCDNETLTWTIALKNDVIPTCTNVNSDSWNLCSYGISLSIDDVPMKLASGIEASYSIVDYSSIWTPRWDQHHIISIPIIKIKIGDQSFAVSTQLHGDIQFIQYHDNDETYLKVSTKSTTTPELSFKLTRIEGNTDLIELYKKLYPGSEARVDFWKTVFHKMNNYFEVDVSTIPFTANQISSFTPAKSHVYEFAPVLWKEANAYPKKFFRSIGIKRMILCESIRRGSEKLPGCSVNDSILLDITNESVVATLHHEIYHFVERNSPALEFDLRKIQLFPFTLIPVAEIPAEIFAYHMADPAWSKSAADHDNQIALLCQKIEQNVKMCDPSFIWPNYSFAKDPTAGLQLARQVARDTESTGKGSQPVLGLPGIGLSLLKEVLPNVQIQELLDKPGSSYFVRNPLDYCAIRWNKYHENSSRSLRRWINAYQRLGEESIPFLRYEDVVTFNIKAIKLFLSQIDSDGEYKLNTVNVDRVRSCSRSLVPLLRKIWDHYRDLPVMHKLGYAKSFVE